MARNTAPKPDAAEQELQKAEVEYVQLHGSLYQGYDVSPITRGELKVILEDLLVQFGKAPAPEGPVAPEPKPDIDLTGIEQFLGKTLDEMKEIAKMMQIDTSAIDAFDDVQLWKEFVTAAINAKGA